MKGNFLLIAALSGELKPLVKHSTAKSWRRVPSVRGVEIWEYQHKDGCWLAVCAGMGSKRATLAFAEAEKIMRVDVVCSVGWVGSLKQSIPAGTACPVSQVVDTLTGERFRPSHWLENAPIVATTAGVADAKEKMRLASSYDAGLVDMEAATVARIALGKGIPFYCLKAVSDEANAKLPNINPFIDIDGQLRMIPFLLHVLVRPYLWAGLLRLGRNSKKAAQNLAETVYDWLDERAYSRISNGDFTHVSR